MDILLLFVLFFIFILLIVNPNNALLFGGAKGLSTKYDLCNDCYLFKVKDNIWIKILPQGDLPCPRAAHAAASIDPFHIAVYGGVTTKGNLAPDDLYVLDFSGGDSNIKWIKCEVTGKTPGKRYGHTLCYHKPHLILFGGNYGNKLSNEVWVANMENLPQIKWELLETKGNVPCHRMYHDSAICHYGGASNMMIVFGGRGDKNTPLNDCWGLRRHRSGNWDWVKAPYAEGFEPKKRFQHTITFYYNFLIVIGGRNDTEQKMIPIEVYDTESSEWETTVFFNKYRHHAWLINDSIYTQGGFELVNTVVPKKDIITIDLIKLFNSHDKLKIKLGLLFEEEKKRKELEIEKAKKTTPTLSPINSESMNKPKVSKGNRIKKEKKAKEPPMNSIMKPLIQNHGELAIVSNNKEEKLIIKQVQFDNHCHIKIQSQSEVKPLCDTFIEYLLNPAEWLSKETHRDDEVPPFHFSIEDILKLADQCIKVLESQPNILRVSAPVKVFGDIHGQYIDLMNFFDKWGCPSEAMNGDIMSNDYLFLGDYVDRGRYSLETICLLMALKVKYPDQIHLLRGNHEDIAVNWEFGFKDECEDRLDDDSENEGSIFYKINDLFEYLPLAAVIEDQILCLHGGLGRNVIKLSDIEAVKRPFEVIHEAKTKEEKVVMDVLWSDPTETDEELGILPNDQRDPAGLGIIVKYGPDIVKKFLTANNLSHIIRAHECVMDGFERFAGGLLITVFSATDYCGTHKNAGAMIVINQQRAMIPHLIYPPEEGNNNWINDEEYYKRRPPTPPRMRYNQSSY